MTVAIGHWSKDVFEGIITVAIEHWSEYVLLVIEGIITVAIEHWSEDVLFVIEAIITVAIGYLSEVVLLVIYLQAGMCTEKGCQILRKPLVGLFPDPCNVFFCVLRK